MNNAMYHATPKRNLPGILRQGLVPKIGLRARSAHEKTPVVYMFRDKDSILDALMGWLGEEFEDEEIVILEITLPASYAKSLSHTPNFEMEIRCSQAIPPEHFRVLSEERFYKTEK